MVRVEWRLFAELFSLCCPTGIGGGGRGGAAVAAAATTATPVAVVATDDAAAQCTAAEFSPTKGTILNDTCIN